MVKAYLKQVCELEKEVHERDLMLNKANKEYEEAQKRIAAKEEQLKKEVEDRKSKVTDLSMEIKKASAYVPEKLGYIIVGFLAALLITVLLGWGIRALVLNVFHATNAGSATLVYMGINLLPIIAAYIFETNIDYSSNKKYIFIGIYIVITILTFLYFWAFEHNGHTISRAMTVFELIVLAIEIIAGIITYLVRKKKIEKETVDLKRWLDKKQFELNKLRIDMEIAERILSDYITSSKKSLGLMNQDIENQKQELANAQIKLKNLYGQDVLHPKYQNWVAAATIYEYFDIGICRELKGNEGAYKFYEEQLIGKQIISSLSEIRSSVISQGYRLLDSQNYIRRQLSECNMNLSNYRFNTYNY